MVEIDKTGNMSIKNTKEIEELIAKIDELEENDLSFTNLIESLTAHAAEGPPTNPSETEINKHHKDGRPHWIHFS